MVRLTKDGALAIGCTKIVRSDLAELVTADDPVALEIDRVAPEQPVDLRA